MAVKVPSNLLKVWDTKLTMRQLTINMAIITQYVCNTNTFFIFYDPMCRFVHCSVQHLLPSIIHWPLKLEPKLSFLFILYIRTSQTVYKSIISTLKEPQ